MTLVFNYYKLLVAIVNQVCVTGTLESTRNLLAGEELHKLFRYTQLKSGDVGPNVGKAAGNELLLLSAISLQFSSHRDHL